MYLTAGIEGKICMRCARCLAGKLVNERGEGVLTLPFVDIITTANEGERRVREEMITIYLNSQ